MKFECGDKKRMRGGEIYLKTQQTRARNKKLLESMPRDPEALKVQAILMKDRRCLK